ncbi:PLP-dependent aminotransferase family protein [Streptomyces sp. GTA36]
MVKSWATFGVDLHVDVTRTGSGLRKGLTDALRAAVRGGRLAPGTRLPSSRSLAADLGIARNTVADAYADLVAEGWLTARQGSGTRVAERAVVAPASAPPRPRTPGGPAYDLVPGTPDLASFPRAEWLKASRRALAAAPYDALGYGDPRGRVELRTALASYLARARGVRADPERILICSGFAHGLMLLGAVLRQRGARALAMESYGLDVHWNLVERAGLRSVTLPFDELGTRTEELTGGGLGGSGSGSGSASGGKGGGPGGVRAVLLTPAHQFPMGVPLHPDRRAAVVDWARRTGGLILEDDYDGEFRYDRQPVGALQGLDPDHVVYMGTASKALAPGLRLGWLVLPPDLAAEVAAAKGYADWSCGVLDQLTLAEFITSGRVRPPCARLPPPLPTPPRPPRLGPGRPRPVGYGHRHRGRLPRGTPTPARYRAVGRPRGGLAGPCGPRPDPLPPPVRHGPTPGRTGRGLRDAHGQWMAGSAGGTDQGAALAPPQCCRAVSRARRGGPARSGTDDLWSPRCSAHGGW